MRYAILLIALLCVITFSFAQTVQPSGNPVCSTINYGNGTVGINQSDPNCQNTMAYAQLSCSNISIFSEPLRFFSCGLDMGMNTLVGGASNDLTYVVNVIFGIMFQSLDITALQPQYNAMETVAMSALSILVALLGLYWIAGARSIEGRMNAKIWSERLIALIIMEAVGFFLFKLALGLNDYIAGSVTSQLSAQTFGFTSTTLSITTMIVVLVVGWTSVLLTVLTLVVRLILLGVLAVLFPFTILLYMTPPTKRWGSVALNLTLAMIFLGALDSIVLYGGSTAANLLGVFGVDVILKPIVMFVVLGIVGTLNIYILLMVPGLSGGIGSTVVVQGVANGGMTAANKGISSTLQSTGITSPEPPPNKGAYI